MTNAAKRKAATLLLALALAAIIVGGLLWSKANNDADHQQRVNAYAIELGTPPSVLDSAEPDHTPALALFALSGVAVVCATILFATS